MNIPTPALTTQRNVQRLPRVALILLCSIYLLPVLFARDPWKNADISAFGYMLNIARGWAEPLHPMVGGVPANGGGLFPYWIGAAFIKLLPSLDPAFAARIPFALMLGGVLAFTWYSAYYLARTQAAQPLTLAFGGEPRPGDYARAIADGALLALVATLGLLQPGHETTPELVQLTGLTTYLYVLSAISYKQTQLAAPLTLLALPLIAGSGAPGMALLAGLSGLALCYISPTPHVRRFIPWILTSCLLLILTGWATSTWHLALTSNLPHPLQILRTLSWFTWPSWLLAGWTIWQWRQHIRQRHIAVPLTLFSIGFLTYLTTGASDRSLLLALPALAVLAAFALPTFKRSVASAIDWFSVFFFSILALAIWFFYAAMHTGFPAKTAANVLKLAAPGFKAEFTWISFMFAASATLAWFALVRWRTQRSQHAIWKSLVLPAGGVAMCWLLFMTLGLQALDHARSYRNLVERVARQLPPHTTLAAPGVQVSLLTALQYFGQLKVDGITPLEKTPHRYLLISLPARTPAPMLEGWQPIIRERQRTLNTESIIIYRRTNPIKSQLSSDT